MKRVVSFLMLLTAAFIAQAVEDSFSGAGNTEIGGSAAMSFVTGNTIVALAPRIGFFSAPGFEMEGEPSLILQDSDWGSSTTINLVGNLLYHFEITNTNNIPFILAGCGFTTSSSGSYSEAGFLLNLGAGIKIPITKDAALRLEYRFQRLFSEYSASNHNILLGLSVFLKKKE